MSTRSNKDEEEITYSGGAERPREVPSSLLEKYHARAVQHQAHEEARRQAPVALQGMKPDRGDTYRGIYIPVWLLRMSLSADAMVTWGAMARLAGHGRRLRDATHARIGSITGLSKSRTRRAIDELEASGVVAALNVRGGASEFAFRAPPPDHISWSRHVHLVDAGSDDPWRPW